MKKKLLKKLKGNEGSSTFTALVTGAFILIIALFAFDYLKAFSVQENLTEELYSLSNSAIKGAMYSSFYRDRDAYFDDDLCKDLFYGGLEENLKLSPQEGMYYCYDNDGNINYVLKIEDMVIKGSKDAAKEQIKLTGSVFVHATFLKKWYSEKGYIYPIYVETKPITTIGL